MNYITSLVAKIDLGSYSRFLKEMTGPEMLFTGLVLVFMILYGLSLGRTRALISLLGIYIAFVFNSTFVYFSELYEWIPIKDTQLIRILVFILVYLLVFFILNRSLVKSRMTLREASFFSVFFISVLQLGLLISIIANLLSEELLVKLPDLFRTYFASGSALFYWSLAPLLVLIFLKNKD